jgi:nucleolin
MEESSDSEEESDSDSDEEEEKTGPTLEELKAAMKEAKKAFKADKSNKDLKKAFKAAPAKKAKEEETAEEDTGMKVVDNSKASSNPMANEKLFIGNLSFDIDDAGIKAFFKDCGELTDVFWLKDRDTDRFKGCGFVTFETVDQACKAVEMNGQELMGREIRIDFAKPRPGGNKPKGKSREARPLSEKPDGCMTVFCGNLSFDIDDTKMQEFATEAGCGEISHIRWLTDRDTGDFKGCGFIEFGDTADVDKFVLKNGADCMGRNIRCDYAKPRAPRD